MRGKFMWVVILLVFKQVDYYLQQISTLIFSKSWVVAPPVDELHQGLEEGGLQLTKSLQTAAICIWS